MISRLLTPSLARELIVISTWLFILFIVGSIFGAVLWFLIIGLLAYVVWNLYNLNKLTKWLEKPSKQPPEVTGIWDDVYFQIYHLYKRQRKARKKLTSILTRFKKSTQALPYATIILNDLHEIEWFNPAAGQLFNLHASIDTGQRLDNLIRQPEFVSYLQKKKFKEPLLFTVNQKKLLLNITSYGDGQHLVSARDITTRSQLDDMRRDFISNASHELRTPLTVMSGYVEFMQHRADDKTKEPLDKIQQQIQRMNLTITELIELSRLESSPSLDFSDVVDVKTLLNDVYNEALSLDQNKHHLTLSLPPETQENATRLSLYGSYDELRMAFSNLLTNAIRYTPEEGDIELFFTSHETGTSVGVKDTGSGIDYEHIPRLTERFYRIDEGRSRT